MATSYYQDPFGAPGYSAEGMPSLFSLSNLESLGRGSVAGLLDLPSIMEKMLMGDVDPRMPSQQTFVPSSEQALARMPRMTQPTPQAGLLETAGAFMSPAPVAAVKPVAKAVAKGGKAVARMAGEEINAAMMGERGGLLGAVTPQPMNVLPPKQFRGTSLEGLPSKVNVGGTIEEFGTDQRLVDIAKGVTEKKGLVYSPQLKYAEIDPDRATRLANQYELMQNNPSDPKVKKAYNAMIDETLDQYEALRKAGYQFNFMPEGGDIYGNPRNAINDIVMNKRLSVFPTEQGFGGPSAAKALEANPLLMRIGEKWQGKDVTANDVFRAVHDVFGHAKYGTGFRAGGEENAFQAHARMYSPEALPAVTSETRGQNSWVNFGPYGAQNRIANPALTEYAEQKTGIMQPWTWQEGLLNIK